MKDKTNISVPPHHRKQDTADTWESHSMLLPDILSPPLPPSCKHHPEFCSLHKVLSLSVQSPSRVRLCDPMDCSTPGLPVHHQLPKLTQTHVHRVGDAIQLSRPLSSSSPPAFNLSNESVLPIRWPLKYWSSASASVLPVNIQD